MIQSSIRLVWRGVILAFLFYLLFLVQLGERSAFGHLMRVIKTDEARELGHEVGLATRRVAERIGEQVEAATSQPELEAAAAQVQEAARDELEEIVEDAVPLDRPLERASDAQTE